MDGKRRRQVINVLKRQIDAGYGAQELANLIGVHNTHIYIAIRDSYFSPTLLEAAAVFAVATGLLASPQPYPYVKVNTDSSTSTAATLARKFDTGQLQQIAHHITDPSFRRWANENKGGDAISS